MTLCSGRSLSRMYDDQRENLMVKIMINMQRKHITTFLTYESHVEPPLHLLELVVDATARPGPGLEARALDAGVRGAAPLVRPARLRLPVSAPVSVAPPPLPLTLPLPLPALLRDDGRGCNK